MIHHWGIVMPQCFPKKFVYLTPLIITRKASFVNHYSLTAPIDIPLIMYRENKK